MTIIEQLREQLSEKVREIEAKDKQLVEIKQSIDKGLHQMKLKPEDSETLQAEQKEAEESKTNLEIEKLELELELTEIEQKIAAEKQSVKDGLINQIKDAKNKAPEGGTNKMTKNIITQTMRQLANGTINQSEPIDGVTVESGVVYYDTDKVFIDEHVDIPELQNYITVEKTSKGSVDVYTYEEGFNRPGLYLEEELAANKEIALPKYKKVSKSINTYRGQTTLSQEAVMDESERNIEEITRKELSLNSTATRNRVIKEAFDTFGTKTVKTINDLKNALINGINGVSSPTLIVNKSALADITDLRYATGQYVFIQATTGEISGHIFGVPVVAIDDAYFGTIGTPKAVIVGKNSVMLKDRLQKGAGWFVNENFAQRLGAYDRFLVHVQYPKGGLNLDLAFEDEVIEDPAP